MRTFEIGEQHFLLDGEPFRVLAGALHYFRVHPDQWRDRVRKARQMGLNTVETYIPWNAHEPQEGDFSATGQLDLGRFLDIVREEEMYAIVRPGPYICAEWTNGGLPSWLFTDPAVGIRRNEPIYMAAVTRYFENIGPIVAPRQLPDGGPVILIQIENEYGAYGSDSDYLRALVELNRAVGLTVPFTTVDQPQPEMLLNGSLPELHRTASFGTRAAERLATLREHQPTGPLMCSEFWNGWFDYWGSHHHAQSAQSTAAELDALLAAGASVNLYMFHGGANFGFTSGANDKGIYRPTVTSYSYDAPLDEAGNPTEKYWAFRDVIAKYSEVEADKPAEAPTRDAIEVNFHEAVRLEDAASVIGQWTSHPSLPTMDAVNRYEGFMLYRTNIRSSARDVLEFADVRDRAQIIVSGTVVATASRDSHERAVTLPVAVDGELTILLEDQGRVNYGPLIGEPKGLIAPARLGGEELGGWQTAPLQLEDADAVARVFEGDTLPLDRHIAGPTFARARFDLADEQPTSSGWYADRYLDTAELGKGVVWLNGLCLGRYWSRGPQRTLLIPGPVLREHDNTLIVFEQHVGVSRVRVIDHAELGHTEL